MLKLAGTCVVALMVLGGCATQPGSLLGVVQGSDKLKTPKCAVKGRTAYDQKWINVTTEALVDGFGQPRPKPRSACGLDRPAPKVAKKVQAKPKVTPGASPEAPTKSKRKWWQRSKGSASEDLPS